MHTVRLLLNTTEYDRQVFEKRFHAANHIHNVLVKHARKLLTKLSHDREYQALKGRYAELMKKDRLSAKDRKYRKQLTDGMNAIIRSYGLSEYSFQSYIKVCAAQFRKCLSSQQVQKEATRVWRGVEKVLYGDGKQVHFKKYADFHTIGGKSNTNGAKFHKDTFSVEWLGLDIGCRMPKDSSYITEALDSDISYCEIERKMFPNGWHYYVIVYLKGDAPHKLRMTEENITGIDIGTSTVAAVSDHMALLDELAPKCKDYNARIRKLLKHMDLSRRAMNPGKYHPDGTIDRSDHTKWEFSGTYRKMWDRLRSLYRQKSEYIRQSHEALINSLLADSTHFIVEEMSFKGLQRRAKKTGRQDRASAIGQKDGSVKLVHKYKRRKRFGRSLNDRAPASFIIILERKAALYGGSLQKADTKKFRASRYDHITDTYTECPLGKREKWIGGHKVQRDLYSAFLLKNSNTCLDGPDRERCMDGFGHFIKMHDERITEMKSEGISMKQCFGF